MNFDASINLYTAGFTMDFSNERVDLGLDCAFNFGSQKTRNVDQNKVLPLEKNNDGMEIVKLRVVTI